MAIVLALTPTWTSGQGARAFIRHLGRRLARAGELDWDIEQARILLGDFAGMTEEGLADV
jgi:hypothetical protein